MSPSYSTLTVEEIGRVRRVTLNRPDQHNPLTPRCVREILGRGGGGGDRDPRRRVVIIRSTGRSFSSGYGFIAEDTDPGDFPAHEAIEGDVSAMLTLADGWSPVWDCPIPVIAQVQGNCLAGGTDLALHCDLVVAADDARIGFPPVRSMGVPPTNMWLYHLGPQWTKRLLFTGDTLSGRRGQGPRAWSWPPRRPTRSIRWSSSWRTHRADRPRPPGGEQAGRQHGRRADGTLPAAAVRRRSTTPSVTGPPRRSPSTSGSAKWAFARPCKERDAAFEPRPPDSDVGQRGLGDAERAQGAAQTQKGRQADREVEDLGIGERRPAGAR